MVKIGSVAAEILVTLSLLWVVVVVGGVQSHFHVKPNLGYVRVAYGGWVGWEPEGASLFTNRI